MAVLTVNSGSTSVKLALYEVTPLEDPERLAIQHHTGSHLDASTLLAALAAQLPAPPEAIAHRIVHGGTRFVRPTPIDQIGRAHV
jgi:acetate kinase